MSENTKLITYDDVAGVESNLFWLTELLGERIGDAIDHDSDCVHFTVAELQIINAALNNNVEQLASFSNHEHVTQAVPPTTKIKAVDNN